jgi:nicotinic acid mononucleotide adenylyltransferase
MNGEQIIKDYNFLVCDRSSDSISSTEIRNRIKKKEDISKYVNPNVINLIKKYYE